MVEAHEAITGYLRGRREASGLSRAELARKAGVSEGLIQKLEQGTRPPTSTTLGALFDALEVPAVYREYAATVLQPELTPTIDCDDAPNQAELDFLNSLPHPACYQTLPGLDVIAANAAYRRAFPGLEPGTNVIAWMLLNPVARVVIDDWEREAHLQVHAFRHMAPGVTAPHRIEEITRLCARSPDWQRLWSTDIPPADIPRRPVRIRPAEGGDWTTMYVQLLRCELPRRDWWVYSMVPIGDSAD
ncbi:helix-turn-helix domain-containing protein [Nocardia uniformis]|uniref:helix-turn-helix domain-containing protein n=1 Tax=Nocardia uniformis TaxID=53432 RepID=UPI0008312CE7|nr:helix-turn-helix domain-containing protein [Nocardia uniformis]